MDRAFNKAGEDILKSMMKYLNQLQECTNLTRVEVVVPMNYGIDWEDLHPGVDVQPPTRDTRIAIYTALSKLHISQELRVGYWNADATIKALGQSLGLERIGVFLDGVVFLDGGVYPYEGEGDEFGYWKFTEDEKEL